jgi:NADH:ubiquinone oxidoreductase subunit 6 (subunit J)
MSAAPLAPWILVVLGPLAIVAGWLVFRFDSMVRATYALMVSFLATAVLLLALNSEFMFAITFLMMIGEMMIMVMFMVAFMMNPAGLNPMSMVHQPRVAAGAGAALFVLLATAIVSADFPEPKAAAPEHVTAAIGHELLGPSMLIFETAGVTLLCGMIAVIALAARRGRFEDAIPVEQDGSGHQHGHD